MAFLKDYFSIKRKRSEIITELSGYQGEAFSARFDDAYRFSGMGGNPAKEASSGYRESIAIIYNTMLFFFDSEQGYARRLLQNLHYHKDKTSDIEGGTVGAIVTAISLVEDAFDL